MKSSLVFPLIRSAVSAGLLAAVAAAAAPKPSAGIRAILANHQNANGPFVTPVPVTVADSLLWDGEHRSPNTVGPEGLQPAKAWEIHPIKQLAER
jgi:hypothetical protein